MNALVAEWVAKAEGDFATAGRELRARRSPNYDAACYHSQQCAEKYLKAFLVANRASPPPIHNLIELLRICLTKDGTFEMIRPDLETLNGYGVIIRYPGMTAMREDAAEAVKSAQRVRNFVSPKI